MIADIADSYDTAHRLYNQKPRTNTQRGIDELERQNTPLRYDDTSPSVTLVAILVKI